MRRSSDERVALLCLPYAGGSAAVYREWTAGLPAWIELVPLHLPGRGARYLSPLLPEWPALCDWLRAESRPQRRRPWALFGHSMGALLALELAHEVRRHEGPEAAPMWLGVSGCAAPGWQEPEAGWLQASRAVVVDRLQRLGGTPAAVLAHDELLELALPVLRNDFHLCGSYRPIATATPRAPLTSPLLVLSGASDPAATPRERVTDWCRETSGPTQLVSLDDGHFFLDSRRSAVIAAVVASLQAALAGARRATDFSTGFPQGALDP